MLILPSLPYDYSALEPFIDTETMHLHHDKHHETYVKNTNDALKDFPDLLKMDPTDLYLNLDKVPEEIRQKVKNNLGGHINHSMFWKIMCENSKSQVPNHEQNLMVQIQNDFGDFENFKTKFSEKALGHFGSGWAWLAVNQDKKLEITDTSNQDSPITYNLSPILCLDVWEHAYYLKYKNMRADYIKAWWNVVNWVEVEKRFGEVIKR